MSRHSVYFMAACLWLAGSSVARTEEPAPQIGTREVALTFATRGIRVLPEQILMPFAVPTRGANADLEITTFEPLDATHARVRLRCRKASNCLPFLVLVSWHRDSELLDADETWRRLRPQAINPIPKEKSPLLVRSGDTATLVLDGQHVHIQLPVICLASGSAGKTIRVTTTDRRHTYLAQIVAAGLLRRGL